MIASIAAVASVAESSRPSTTAWIACRMSNVGCSAIAAPPESVAECHQLLRRAGEDRSAQSEEVRQQVFPDRSQDRLGMELDTLDVELAVAQTHDRPIVGLGG